MTKIILQPYASPIIALILAAIAIKRFAPLVTSIKIFLVNPFWLAEFERSPYTIQYFALVIPAYLYVLVLAWGKKKESKGDDQ